jgi:hypothetical protein
MNAEGVTGQYKLSSCGLGAKVVRRYFITAGAWCFGVDLELLQNLPPF